MENPDQPLEIEGLLSRLMDEGLRSNLAKKGRELAKQLTWEKTTDATLGAYRKILDLKKIRQINS